MCVGIDDKSSFDWVDSKEDFVHSVASEYDGEVVVQAFQDGFEIGAPVVRSGSQVNVIGLVGFSKKNAKTKYWKTARTFSEENLIKNVENYSVDFLDNNTILEMEDYALKISQLFQVNGFARIDFRVSLDGAPYVIDVNESPPPLLKSSLGFLMDSYGYTYEDMLAMYTALSFG
jgi:D-alanine-D-alanine ligase-like ATP-grasp enzyme